MRGGSGNVSFIKLSWDVILHQWQLVMAETDGSLGSHETINTGLLLCRVFLATFRIATAREIDLAFAIAEFTNPAG